MDGRLGTKVTIKAFSGYRVRLWGGGGVGGRQGMKRGVAQGSSYFSNSQGMEKAALSYIPKKIWAK